MSEKLCLQWNDFKENVNSAFGRLRDDKEFTDVTLAYEDGQQMEAHKVILAASSPLFEKILQRSKHPHPLIYLGGLKSEDMMAILDFIYFGEAKVHQENLDSFLAMAEELKLKGLTGQTSNDVVQKEQKLMNTKEAEQREEFILQPAACRDVSNAPGTNDNTQEIVSRELFIPVQIGGDLQTLEEKVMSMMERSKNTIPAGTQANGTRKQTRAAICKVCGKEGLSHHIKDHIEVYHLEGISIPCDNCEKSFSARPNLRNHKTRCLK